MHPTDHVLLVTFRLAGLSPGDYGAHCASIAGRFAALPGLRSKLWLADADTNTYGGLYRWADRDAAQAYLAGPVFQALREAPGLADVTAREFSLLEAPTRITDPVSPQPAVGPAASVFA
jgi:hypothetical protein